MKDFFIGLFVGIFLTGFLGWYFTIGRELRGVRETWDSVGAKMVAWHLRPDDIQKELSRTGQVFRRQVRDFGEAMGEATSDARITATIKTKLALNKDLSALSISVSTADRRVTLAGSVESADQIGKAMLIALETDGVKDCVSTMQVKKK